MTKLLNQVSGMPKMSAAFRGWTNRITLTTIKQTIIDGFVVEDEKDVSFYGVIQPLTQEELKLKPEGERSWQWMMIHCSAGELNLATNDKIVFGGVRYKIMAIKDYSLNAYVEYHAVRDYESEA
jgi:hypothetical protein